VSRSGYNDDGDDTWGFICYRGQVASATRGKRGQALLREALVALDAMPVKELIADQLVQEGSYCLLGVVGAARGVPLSEIDPEDYTAVAKQFDIAEPLAREIMFENDNDFFWSEETPAQRWMRMREWIAGQIKVQP
jgi:hypothetical protein